MYVDLRLAVFDKSSKDDLKNALEKISNCDEDFNGNNGPEYLWKKAIGYKSNQEYTWNQVKDLPYKNAIEEFVRIWIEEDTYYEATSLEIVERGNIVSVAFTHAAR